MRNFSSLLTSVLLAVVFASSASAIPIVDNSQHATHSRRQLRSGRSVTTYHPRSTFETYGEGLDHPLRKRGVSLKESATAWVQNKLDLQDGAVTWQSGFAADHASYGYVKQSKDGLFFANAVANVAFNADEKVVSFGSSFVKPTSYASATPSLDLDTAQKKAESMLGGTTAGLPDPELKWFAKEDGTAALAHSFQVKNDEDGAWVEALVDAHSGEMLSIVDYVAEATYTALPIKKQTLVEGLEKLVDPEDLLASPQGWHFDGQGNTTTTAGNNAISFKGSIRNGVTQESAPNLVFEFAQDPKRDPTFQPNVDAARVNAFVAINTVHDIAYRYGFTEKAFNFQFDNFGLGGKGNDPVTASVQDASGVNNANFATPPDGQPGRMRMFIFTLTKPNRDGALENDVVVHENMHGITNRMTGGGTATCLQSLEAGGLGEGWWTTQKSATVKDFVVGPFVSNKAGGLRSKPFSTDAKVNPLTFASAGQLQEVHNIGEVWANMLHNVYAALVAELGFADDAAKNPDGTQGNIVFMHLMLDALALQPCQPTFITARDAWLQADKNRFNGANTCTVAKAFASRGLGTKAKNFVNDFSVPAGC
ncbi:Fungalysin metallopeptidase-domain-containing protein [Mycena belliarum]|uniref:Extracellular metalloproteinase n=1 Tax=Mycena belliarum TaxID=1033014 RepID=A0AAD6XH04_9AGAR|nr:Fungalysin metallopeptidase-domain-containing protein [Mycena belliae]